MRKSASFILSILLVIGFSACMPEPTSSSESESQDSYSDSSIAIVERTAEEILDLFTASDAKNILKTDGTIEYDSEMEFDELKAFLKDAIKTIGGMIEREEENKDGAESYSCRAAYEGDKSILILVIQNVPEMGSNFSVTVTLS